MKSFIVLSTISSAGMMTGNIFFDQNSTTTIKDVLEKNSEKILDTNSNSEEGLILAQKYRENNTVKLGSPRDFKSQQDPNFLDVQFGDEKIKYVGSLKEQGYKGEENDFSKDKEIAEELKKTCEKSLSKPYEGALYAKVKQWCRFYLPEYARKVFRTQFEKGCRFWLVNTAANSDGWFLWEVLEGVFAKESEFIKNLEKGNLDSDCTSKKDKILPLSLSNNSGQKKDNGSGKDFVFAENSNLK